MTAVAGVALRVASYNVRHRRDDPHALRRVLRALGADVLCVQEGPRGPRWRASQAALARDAGMVVVTGGPRPGSNLLLSSLRLDLVSTHDVRFPVHHRLQPRGAAVARLRIAGHDLLLSSTHLSLDPRERPDNVSALLDHLRPLPPAVRVVAGDLNETPGGPAWSLLEGELVDALAVAGGGGEHTSSAVEPRRRIDAVFVSPGTRVVAAGVPHLEGLQDGDLAAASDHLPVVADLVLG